MFKKAVSWPLFVAYLSCCGIMPPVHSQKEERDEEAFFAQTYGR